MKNLKFVNTCMFIVLLLLSNVSFAVAEEESLTLSRLLEFFVAVRENYLF